MFANVDRRQFREVVLRPVRLGATIHPEANYDDGEAYYVSPAVIIGWTFNFEAAHAVTDKYYQDNVRHCGLREGDLVIAGSGEGTIGKAALFLDTVQGDCRRGGALFRRKLPYSHNPLNLTPN